MKTLRLAAAAAAGMLGCASVQAQGTGPANNGFGQDTAEPAQMTAMNGYHYDPLFTIGESVGSYTPVGIFDGLAAFRLNNYTVRVIISHELTESGGSSYVLQGPSGLPEDQYAVTGTRLSYLDVNRFSRQVTGAGLAYDTVYDRTGNVADDPSDLNQRGDGDDAFAPSDTLGLSRFCSARGVAAGTYGFVDNIYFTGEETGKPFHPHGGTEFALDVDRGELWALPNLGRANWENLTPIAPPSATQIALIVGDDTAPAPLSLWIGEKVPGNFLQRNGLDVGQLYVWVADGGVLDPGQFRGTGNAASGTFQPIASRDAALAGTPGHDKAGYKDIDTLQAEAFAMGAFAFSRPEDVHDNPHDGTQVVLASTGRTGLFGGVDSWGTVYLLDIDTAALTATAFIRYDGDDAGSGQFAHPDMGPRSPDNLCWAGDGLIYIQEDRANGALFGATSGEEASIWALNPVTGAATRIAQVDRTALPAGQFDGGDPTDIGQWESSGILDVTDLFNTRGSERLLLGNVQAHDLVNLAEDRHGSNLGADLVIGGKSLGEGGQLFFLSTRKSRQW